MARRDKHFPESKAHPRIHKHLTQKHAQTPKHMSCLLGEVLFCRLKVVLKIVDTNIISLFPCLTFAFFNSRAIKPYSQATSVFFLWDWYLLHRTLKYLICMAHKELLVTWCNIYWHNNGMAWVHNTWSILGPQCL